MGVLLLFLALAGLVLAVVLVVLALVSLGRAARRRRGAWLVRGLALAAAAGAVAAYMCGLALVGLDAMDAGSGGADSSPPQPCRTGPAERWGQVADWEVGFVPVRFECRLASGKSYANATVPGWVNPATALFGLAAAGLGIGARAAAERVERRTPAAV
ncbi:hypothetical protein [Kitasatospora sp. NPDC085879]|uniref:hypothetical protein n=1 Tax=Kitasatospora sp. NPDC085879 TaxID=3154769 RepID=UPI003419436A